jgi:WD40 repeat protein
MLQSHEGAVNSVAFSPGRNACIDFKRQTVLLWDVATGAKRQLLGSDGSVAAIFLPDGKTLFQPIRQFSFGTHQQVRRSRCSMIAVPSHPYPSP